MAKTPPQQAAAWLTTPPETAAPFVRTLAAHRGPYLSAAALAAAAGTRLSTAQGHLSLLTAVGATSTHGTRYRLADHLSIEPAGDAAATHRLTDWYLGSVDAALAAVGMNARYWKLPDRDPVIVPQAFTNAESAHAWLLDEDANLTAVLAAANEAGLAEHTWVLAEFLFEAWSYRAVYDRWEATAQTGIEAARAVNSPVGEAIMLSALARGYSQRGRTRRAEALQRQAHAIREREADRRGLAYSSNALGMIAFRDDDLEAALERFRDAEAIAHSCDDGLLVACARTNQGDTLRELDRLDEAEERLQQARDYFVQHSHGQYAASCQRILADVLLRRGRINAAVTAAEQALAESALQPSPAVLAAAHRTNACVLWSAGCIPEAIESSQAAATLYASVGDLQRCAKLLDLAADLYAEDGNRAQADVLRAEAVCRREALHAADADSSEAAD